MALSGAEKIPAAYEGDRARLAFTPGPRRSEEAMVAQERDEDAPVSRDEQHHAEPDDASDDEIQGKFEEYRRTRDRDLRNELVQDHMRLAEFLARRFAHRGEPLDDLRQVALVGLLKAVERFEPGRGLKFSSFAR